MIQFKFKTKTPSFNEISSVTCSHTSYILNLNKLYNFWKYSCNVLVKSHAKIPSNTHS